MVYQYLHPDQEEDLPEIDENDLPDPVVDDDDNEEASEDVLNDDFEMFEQFMEILKEKPEDEAMEIEVRAKLSEILDRLSASTTFNILVAFNTILNSDEQQSQ